MVSLGSRSTVRTSRRVWRFVRGCVRVDTRSLAAFRIGAGLLILVDLLSRSRNLHLFYTDGGVVPRTLAADLAPYPLPSVYAVSGEPSVTAALFVVHALIALLLLVGYHTRLASVLAFVFVVSLDLRNPLVLSYADTLFAVILFWAMFVPLGERWSVDAVHADRPARPAVASVGTALLLSQMVVMYVVNGVHKTESPLWLSGEAAVLILGLDHMTFLVGDAIRAVPTLVQAGGLLWVGMLLTAWLLLVLRGRARTGFVLLFVGGHAALAGSVRIGAFSFVCIAGLLPFLQTSAWGDARSLATRAGLPPSRADGLVDRLSDTATRFPQVDWRTWGPIGALGGYVPARGRVVAGAIVLLVCTVAVLSLGGVGGGVLGAGPDADQRTVDRIEGAATAVVDFQTEWSIFAPHPRVSDQYFVFAAETADGEVVDAYGGRPLAFDRPYDELQRQYPTYRHRFYMNSVRSGEDPRVREYLADHVCAQWADTQGGATDLVRLELFHVSEEVTRETIDAPEGRARKVAQLSRHGCGDAESGQVATPE